MREKTVLPIITEAVDMVKHTVIQAVGKVIRVVLETAGRVSRIVLEAVGRVKQMIQDSKNLLAMMPQLKDIIVGEDGVITIAVVVSATVEDRGQTRDSDHTP